jgi:hypothetical protein
MSDTDMTKLKQQIMLRPRATLLQRFLRSVGHRLRRRRQELPAKAVE